MVTEAVSTSVGNNLETGAVCVSSDHGETIPWLKLCTDCKSNDSGKVVDDVVL